MGSERRRDGGRVEGRRHGGEIGAARNVRQVDDLRHRRLGERAGHERSQPGPVRTLLLVLEHQVEPDRGEKNRLGWIEEAAVVNPDVVEIGKYANLSPDVEVVRPTLAESDGPDEGAEVGPLVELAQAASDPDRGELVRPYPRSSSASSSVLNAANWAPRMVWWTSGRPIS